MTTAKRIEAVQLLHELRREGEPTGDVFLRALRALKSLPEVERVRDEWCKEYTALRDAPDIKPELINGRKVKPGSFVFGSALFLPPIKPPRS